MNPHRERQRRGKRHEAPKPDNSHRHASKLRADHPRCPVTGKARFKSQHGAEQYVARGIVKGGYLFTAWRVYDCSHCGGFHVTSQEKRG